MRRGETGSATVLIVGVAALASVLGLFVADVALYVRARTAAAVAADAAALAAAPVTFAAFGASGTPAAEARRFAARNGGVLVSCDCAVDRTWATREVRVLVAVPADLLLFGPQMVHASSRAEFDPTALPR